MMRVRLSTTRRQTFGNSSDFNFRLLPTEQNFASIWSLEIALKHCLVSQVFEIPLRYLHMHKIICLAYFIKMSDPRPVSCPGCLFTSGTKRCREEEIVPPSPSPSLSNHQPCEKARTRRLPSSSSRRHSGIRLIQSRGENPARFFCPAALQLGFFSPLVGLDQIPVIFARKEVDLLSCAFRTSKYQLSPLRLPQL